jgi:uncharacterized metal-binding protein YceD (DUF177 family)
VRLKDEYIIRPEGLKVGLHEFNFVLNDEFFSDWGEMDFSNANIIADVVLNKENSLLTFEISMNGVLSFPCDLCVESYVQDVHSKNTIFFKYGDKSESTEDVVFISKEENSVDLKQYFYEFLILSLSSKRTCKESVIEQNVCNEEVLKILRGEAVQTEEEEIDPRWQVLLKLKNKEN